MNSNARRVKGGIKMLVFEEKIRIKFLEQMPYEETYEKIGYFIDSALGKNSELLKFHEGNGYKWYCVDAPYPVEMGRVYQPNKIYTIRIRTVRQGLAEYFIETLISHKTQEIIGLSGELNIIPHKVIERVYNLTPIVIKTEAGYWKGQMNISKYEERLKVNLIKKYNQLENTKLDENFDLFNLIEFKNKVPVKVPYKGIALLGDKLNIVVAHNKTAQELIYMALGTGMGELNARCCGFLNYRYL